LVDFPSPGAAWLFLANSSCSNCDRLALAERGHALRFTDPAAMLAWCEAAVVNLAGLHGPRWCDPTLAEVDTLSLNGPEDIALLLEMYAPTTELFLDGHLGDFGLALLALWTIAQINPGIPLFAVTFDPEPDRLLAAPQAAMESAGLLIEAAESAFQMLGVGLFLALLLRERRFIGSAVLVLIGTALLLKGIAAAIVIKPAAWDTWQRPGVMMGIAAGALFILAAVNLARPVMVAVCGIALLSSVGVPLLAPDLMSARAPLTLFNWRYGQLLNYNGLTRTILLVWPLLVATWLFALAGRPAWGHPDTRLNSSVGTRSKQKAMR